MTTEYDWEADIAANRKPIEPDLEALKANWLKDPCWDIEETEGFEAHREELLAFRLETESKNLARHEAYRQRVPERYRGAWFVSMTDEDIAEWANKQAAEGYAIRFIVPANKTTYEDNLGPCTYVLMEKEVSLAGGGI